MSVVGGALAGLGGPQVAAVIIAGGLVAGALGSVVVTSVTGPGTTATASGRLPVYPCPDAGPALAEVQGGQRLLATGRTADGTWLRIHYPGPGRGEAWVQAAPLTVRGAAADLPVAACEPELAVALPAVGPAESLTPPGDNAATPEPTPTELPTPTPTPVPDATPSLSGLTVSATRISYDTGDYCPTAVKKATFRVKAADAEGISAVTLFWRAPGAAAFAQSPMAMAKGTAQGGTWQAVLDTKTDSITKAGKLAFYAQGTDTAGATRRIPVSGSSSITVAVCENTGPAITSAASSSGSTLRWDPLGAGGCTTSTTISATVKDTDGVKAVTLYFKRPGSSSYTTKAMTTSGSGGKWTAKLATAADAITIKSPPTDTMSWYIKATDDKNVAAQTKAKSITIRRCDSEATFNANHVTDTVLYTCSTVPIEWTFDVDDPDGLSSATLSYTVVNGGYGGTVSDTTSVKVSGGGFTMSSVGLSDSTFYGANSVTWTITTTDKYGGKTKSSGSDTVSIYSC